MQSMPRETRYSRTIAPSVGSHLMPFAMRYCWPDQLDQMAERAGLRLVERYADCQRRPFDADSKDHVSVYRLG